MSGRSQAVRIPKEYRFEKDQELYVNKIGSTVVITPATSLQDSYRKGLQMFTDDFLADGRPEEALNKRIDL